VRGGRIQNVVNELNGEKIDVVQWDSEMATFIANSLSPAKVMNVLLHDGPDTGKTATVIVPDRQLSLAIGKEGQNARLAAKLTGWRIDIKSATEAAEETCYWAAWRSQISLLTRWTCSLGWVDTAPPEEYQYVWEEEEQAGAWAKEWENEEPEEDEQPKEDKKKKKKRDRRSFDFGDDLPTPGQPRRGRFPPRSR
jgi:transcription antitermination factor NusA-like protein